MSILRNVSGSRWDAGMVISLGQSADLHMAQLMPLPFTISCSSKSRLVLPEWFSFLVPDYPGCPGKKPLNECVVYIEYNASIKYKPATRKQMPKMSASC